MVLNTQTFEYKYTA